MLEQTWWDTPWVAMFLTNGRALVIGILLLMWLGAAVVIGIGLGRKYE